MSEGILITHLVVVGVCELDILNYNKNVLLLHELFLICKKEGNDLHHLDQTIGLSLSTAYTLLCKVLVTNNSRDSQVYNLKCIRFMILYASLMKIYKCQSLSITNRLSDRK